MNMYQWGFRAVQSEIAISAAHGGRLNKFDNYYYVLNTKVPMGGDFNRSIAARFNSEFEFRRINKDIEKIHNEYKIEPPFRMDTVPGVETPEELKKKITELGYVVKDEHFYACETKGRKEYPGYELRSPLPQEYKKWYRINLKMACSFDEKKCDNIILPAKMEFIKTFKPWLLKKEGKLIGWAYMAIIEDCARLYDVKVLPGFIGKGYDTILLNHLKTAAASRNAKHILVSDDGKMSDTFTKNGFTPVVSNHVIWTG